jgi:hypothetical protein
MTLNIYLLLVKKILKWIVSRDTYGEWGFTIVGFFEIQVWYIGI